MATETSESMDRDGTNIFIVWRDGWPSAEQLHKVKGLLAERHKEIHKKGAVKAKDSPIALHTSSIFLDTTDTHGWKQQGASETYTSAALLPLDLIEFRGFQEGHCVVFTNMSWSIESHSKGNKGTGQPGMFYVCSNFTSGSNCDLSGDPSNTATIIATGKSLFCDSQSSQYSKPHERKAFEESHAPAKSRKAFRHEQDPDPNLDYVVLNVGSAFNKTFTCSGNGTGCTIVFGEK